MIFVFSSKNAAITKMLGPSVKNSWIEIKPLPVKDIELTEEDQAYLDISGMTAAEIKKALARLRKSDGFWGIMDPKGAAEDPAQFFFEGASDYIGPSLVKKGLTKKRFSEARSGFAGSKGPASGKNAAESTGKKKAQKLPGGKFEGWKSIRPGTTEYFLFLFVTISKKISLRSLSGDTVYKKARDRLLEALQQGLGGTDALLWMETEGNSLFLVPSRAANCRAAVEASLKLIMNSRLIGFEKLDITIPLEFSIALHYGKTMYQAPGKTGAVISESVNYIFHLGAKKAELGRLTISGDVPEEGIPESLRDLFISAGVFEGIPLRHSRRFIYK